MGYWTGCCLCPSAEAEKCLVLGIWYICSSVLLVNAWNSPSGEIELQFFITVNFSPSSEIILKQCLGLCKRWIWDWREGNGPLWIHCRQNTRRDNMKNASLCVRPHLRLWRQYIYTAVINRPLDRKVHFWKHQIYFRIKLICGKLPSCHMWY